MSNVMGAAVTLLFCATCGCAAGEKAPKNFVRLKDVAPTIKQDMRYAGSNNFTGRPVPGYLAPECWLRIEAAEALARAQKEAEGEGLSLIVYDCYRPQRATKAFVAWAQDADDAAMKALYYPRIDKAALFELGYIAKASAHSMGVAVDLALEGLDFGGPFDLFDQVSATDSPGIGAAARASRAKLLSLMQRYGFSNLPQEWWHFALEGAPDVGPQNFDVR